MGYFKSRLQSFVHAFRGVKILIQEHPNFQIHLIAAIAVIALGTYFSLTTTEWALVLACIGLVMLAEGMNSALEEIMDHLHPERHEKIGKAKDMAAGAVVICALISAVIGILVFLPYF